MAFAPILVQALEDGDTLIAVLRAAQPAPDAVCIEAANSAFCSILGETEPALRGRSLAQLFPADTDASASAELAQSILDGNGGRAELACVTADHRRVWLGFRLLPVTDAGDGVRRYVLMGRDITLQRAAADEQRAVQKLFVGAFQNADVALAITDLGGVIQLANSALHRMLGFAGNTLIGRQTLDLVESGERQRLTEARARHADLGGKYAAAARMVRADGTTIMVDCTVAVAGPQERHRFRVMTFRPRDQPPPAADPPLHVAGKIQLIGLEVVRTALGSRWPELAERAMTTAEHVLRRRLEPGDTCARSGECGFAVCFAHADEEDAGFRAAMIRREIRQRLIGEVGSGAESRVTAIVSSIEAAPDGSVDPVTISSILEDRRAALEGRARETLATALQEARIEHEPVFSGGRITGLTWLAIPPATRQRMATAAGVLGSEEAGDLDLDRLTLDLAIEDMSDRSLQAESAAAATSFLIPLAMDALASKRSANAYVERLRRLDATARSRIMLMLSGDDEAMTLLRLRDAALLLRPLGVKLGLEMGAVKRPPLEPPPQPFGILAVPASALAAMLDANADAARKLVDSLRARGLRLLGLHARGRDEADSLNTIGVTLVTQRGKIG